jgi:pyridoxamine 5'-phosphate oxidase
MNPRDIMHKIEEILEISKVAVLATVDSQCKPCIRWMTPALIKGRPWTLYAVTSPKWNKICHINSNPNVEWMIQTPSLNEIVTIRGKVNVIDMPAIKAEVFESVGTRLASFWRVTKAEMNEVAVLETIIEEATYFHSMQGIKETVTFKQEVENG